MSPRFPQSVYRHGTEPDVRFTLANERTFLAWIRTALALIAGGVALEVLGLALHPGLRLAASLVLIVTGMLTPGLAWLGWERSERALRLNSPLPGSLLGAVAGIAVTVSAALILLAIVFV
ncbi:YidH family protein [Microbacterium sp. bgisy207]|jgi:putative membrane protein|uniref:YidH family protein n=1 Tax=Microbacterium sp. bgisy207 TaxID=3413800 RepID=UPI003EC0E9C3